MTKYKHRKKFRLYQNQAGKCFICGQGMNFNTCTFEHVIPRSLYKRSNVVHHTVDNLVLTHGTCNKARGYEFPPIGLVVKAGNTHKYNMTRMLKRFYIFKHKKQHNQINTLMKEHTL